MTDVIGSSIVERIPGDAHFVRFLSPLRFFSDILGCWSVIPVGFVCDDESVPLVRGTNIEAGDIHDVVCRIDFVEVCCEKKDIVITMTMATRIYLEFQRYYDEKEGGNWFNKGWDWFRRGFKTAVVWVYPNFLYFQKFKVMATYEEITA